MAEAIPKLKRIVPALTALIGVLILFSAAMISFDKYREKLILAPVRLTNDTLLVLANNPQRIRDTVLLLEIKTSGEKNHFNAEIIWNGREFGRIQKHGHTFVKLPRASFLSQGNILRLRGLTAGDTVAILEMKNLYGFSTGLFKLVTVLPDSPSVEHLPWPLATLLALILLFFPVFAPRAMSLTARNRWLRFGAWAINVFFLALLTLPLFSSYGIFLGLTTTLWLLGALHLPGLLRSLRLASGFFRSGILPWIKGKLLHLHMRPGAGKLLAALALAVIFIFFAVHRQRYVGASDWYGYYAESLLFRQGQLTMKTAFPPAQYPAFAPLGFLAAGDKIIPQYPPGFPLLLALFGFLGLEFFVNALCGVLTILVLYLILRNLVGRGLAVLYALLWTFFPVALWGSVNLMSDLVATLFILLTYYFFRRDEIFWSGVAFSFAMTVRPSNILFFIVFLPLIFRKKKFWPFCLSTAIIGSLYGLYNWAVFGKPWMTGYQGVAAELLGSVFFHHFIYYGKTIFIIMTPLLLIPALLALVRRKPQRWFYFFWLLAYWIFYSFWKSGADYWWYLRFLLPGLPALFILSALGMQDIRERLSARKLYWRWLFNAAAVFVLLVMLPYFCGYSKRNMVLTADRGKLFFKASKKIQSLLPPGAMVGSLEMSGPLRLYAGIESFRWDHPQRRKLMYDFLNKGRTLYLLVEPNYKRHPSMERIARNFNLKKIAFIPESRGMVLFQVCLREE